MIQIHKKTHRGPSVRCKICSDSFATKYALTIHEKIHSNDPNVANESQEDSQDSSESVDSRENNKPMTKNEN